MQRWLVGNPDLGLLSGITLHAPHRHEIPSSTEKERKSIFLLLTSSIRHSYFVTPTSPAWHFSRKSLVKNPKKAPSLFRKILKEYPMEAFTRHVPKYLMLICLSWFGLSLQANQPPPTEPMTSQQFEAGSPMEEAPPSRMEKLGWLAVGLGAGGLLMIALPYLSGLGLLLGLVAFGLGWFLRKRTKKKWLHRLARLLGGLSLLYFLGVAALVIFV
jgi:hypothetical protein